MTGAFGNATFQGSSIFFAKQCPQNPAVSFRCLRMTVPLGDLVSFEKTHNEANGEEQPRWAYGATTPGQRARRSDKRKHAAILASTRGDAMALIANICFQPGHYPADRRR